MQQKIFNRKPFIINISKTCTATTIIPTNSMVMHLLTETLLKMKNEAHINPGSFQHYAWENYHQCEDIK